MKANMMKINREMQMPRFDETTALWFVVIDGQTVTAESIDELENKLRKLGHLVVRYPA